MEFSAPIREKIEQYRLECERLAREKDDERRLELAREAVMREKERRTREWIATLQLEPDENGWVSVVDCATYQAFLRSGGDPPKIPTESKVAIRISDPGVYFLRIETGLVKIGQSADPERRIAKIRLEIPLDIEVVQIARCKNPPALESQYHKRFADKRVRGEWFALTEDDLRAIKAETPPPP